MREWSSLDFEESRRDALPVQLDGKRLAVEVHRVGQGVCPLFLFGPLQGPRLRFTLTVRRCRTLWPVNLLQHSRRLQLSHAMAQVRCFSVEWDPRFHFCVVVGTRRRRSRPLSQKCGQILGPVAGGSHNRPHSRGWYCTGEGEVRAGRHLPRGWVSREP